ncbi:MAG: MBL fold metallo-hydrolase [Thermoanaerobaculia bacterium]|nr:MBL fold metallo-hydrolase [Thermoanaerobaculia bacterium]
MTNRISRRDSLKLGGLALGGLALGNRLAAQCNPSAVSCYPTPTPTDRYSYYQDDKKVPWLDYTDEYPVLQDNELRITFMGSVIPPTRLAQAEMSVFVEVGKGIDGKGETDQAVFDLGVGTLQNYGAMLVPFGRMDKIFINHLHGDHMNDLTALYCFGPSGDRKSPLYVFGQSPSGVRTPRPDRKIYPDGVVNFCRHLREACRWHTESFSFESTRYENLVLPTQEDWNTPHPLVPVSDDPPDDGYAMYPIELDWTKTGVAYHNRKSRLKISHFPVIHCRQGSIGYKIEWEGVTVIYTSDTKPELNTIVHGSNGGNGVDVLIHEMVPPPDVWAMKQMGYTSIPANDPRFNEVLKDIKNVQNSSHTPQGAFGYLLSQIYPRPRLTIATHFPTQDDLIECALKSINRHCGDISPKLEDLGTHGLIWSFDRMVIRVFAGKPKPQIQINKGKVLTYGFGAPTQLESVRFKMPKYHDAQGNPDPYYQLDMSTAILPGEDTFCESGY